MCIFKNNQVSIAALWAIPDRHLKHTRKHANPNVTNEPKLSLNFLPVDHIHTAGRCYFEMGCLEAPLHTWCVRLSSMPR